MDWFMGRSRKKEKEQNQVETKLYMQETFLQLQTCKLDLVSLVKLPMGVEYQEWLASNTIKFFELTNLMYGTISEFCTQTSCPTMSAPNSVQYLWFDERGKKCKCAAPQYIDYVMTFIQKCVNDETIFPTKYGNNFPSSFESICKKISRYLLHVMAHTYQAHFRELVLLELHAHLNWLFLHFTMFLRAFELTEEKDGDVLADLADILHTQYRLMNTTVRVAYENINPQTAPTSGTSDEIVLSESASTSTFDQPAPADSSTESGGGGEFVSSDAGTRVEGGESSQAAGSSQVGGEDSRMEVDLASNVGAGRCVDVGNKDDDGGVCDGDGCHSDESGGGKAVVNHGNNTRLLPVAGTSRGTAEHDGDGGNNDDDAERHDVIDDELMLMTFDSCKFSHVATSSSSSSEVAAAEQ